MSRYLLFILVVVSIMTTQVCAQTGDIEKRLAKCAAIKGDLERLACYDELAKELGLIATTSKIEIDGIGKWEVDEKINPIDDSKTVVLMLSADSGQSSMGQSVFLIIRCQSNSTNLYIAWSDYLGSEANVLTRIGKDQAKTMEWSLSTNSQATFYPGSPIPFIKQLIEADTFIAQVTPYGDNPITAVFDVKGLSNAIKPLRQTCGW